MYWFKVRHPYRGIKILKFPYGKKGRVLKSIHSFRRGGWKVLDVSHDLLMLMNRIYRRRGRLVRRY